MNNIFVAFYHGRKSYSEGSKLFVWYARFMDWLTRKVTSGRFSHCEMAVKLEDNSFQIYSSSVRDGGVRTKNLKDLPPDHWVLVPVDCTEEQIIKYFNSVKGSKYDFFGAVGVVIRLIKERSNRLFCSEYCANTLGYNQGWRFSPNDLFQILTRK